MQRKDKVYKNMEHYETDRMVIKFNNFILYKEDIKSSPKHNRFNRSWRLC